MDTVYDVVECILMKLSLKDLQHIVESDDIYYNSFSKGVAINLVNRLNKNNKHDEHIYKHYRRNKVDEIDKIFSVTNLPRDIYNYDMNSLDGKLFKPKHDYSKQYHRLNPEDKVRFRYYLCEKYKTLPQSTKDSMAWSRGKTRFINEQVLIKENILTAGSYVSSSRVRILLFKLKLKKQQCECCGITNWQGKHITFELHHINGVGSDHRLDNLTILCPNCHSITKNYRGKNIKKQPYKTDQEILHALQINDFNRRKALIYLGLTPKGGNYKRLNKFIQ